MATNHAGSLYREKGEIDGVGFGYTVAIALDPTTAQSPRSAGAFGWMGRAGTASWTEPEEELSAVIMVQQPTEDLPYNVAKVIREAIVDGEMHSFAMSWQSQSIGSRARQDRLI